MQAGGLAPIRTVGTDTAAVKTARLLAAQHLPGLLVVNDGGGPSRILPCARVLRVALPRYIQDDPVLDRLVAG